MLKIFLFVLFFSGLAKGQCLLGAEQTLAGGTTAVINTSATNACGNKSTLYIAKASCFNNGPTSITPSTPTDSDGDIFIPITFLSGSVTTILQGPQIVFFYVLKPITSAATTFSMAACSDGYQGYLGVMAFDTVTAIDPGSPQSAQATAVFTVSTPTFTPATMGELLISATGYYNGDVTPASNNMGMIITTHSELIPPPDGAFAYLVWPTSTPFTVQWTAGSTGASPYPSAAVVAFYVSSGNYKHSVRFTGK